MVHTAGKTRVVGSVAVQVTGVLGDAADGVTAIGVVGDAAEGEVG